MGRTKNGEDGPTEVRDQSSAQTLGCPVSDDNKGRKKAHKPAPPLGGLGLGVLFVLFFNKGEKQGNGQMTALSKGRGLMSQTVRAPGTVRSREFRPRVTD